MPHSSTIAKVPIYGRPSALVAREIGVCPATLHRWREDGVLGRDGIRRHLKMVRIGGRWHVRDADVTWFLGVLGGETDGFEQPLPGFLT